MNINKWQFRWQRQIYRSLFICGSHTVISQMNGTLFPHRCVNHCFWSGKLLYFFSASVLYGIRDFFSSIWKLAFYVLVHDASFSKYQMLMDIRVVLLISVQTIRNALEPSVRCAAAKLMPNHTRFNAVHTHIDHVEYGIFSSPSTISRCATNQSFSSDVNHRLQ